MGTVARRAVVARAERETERVTIKLTSLTMLETQHVEPPRAKPHKGDYIAFRDLLVNRGTAQFGRGAGKPVAWDEGLIAYTSASASTIHVLVTFPDLGTITYKGPLVSDAHGDSVIPITDGTGAFEGAHGTVTIGPGSATSANTFEVTVPGHPIEIGSGGGAA